MESARKLQAEHEGAKELSVYLTVLEAVPDHFEALCAASHLYGQVAKRLDGKQRDQYCQRALTLAERALQLRPDDPESNFVTAWAYGGIAMISGVWKKAELAKNQKQSRGYLRKGPEPSPGMIRSGQLVPSRQPVRTFWSERRRSCCSAACPAA